MLFLLIKLLASLHFYKPQSLQRHIKIHTEEKNICCEFCDMKFWMMNERHGFRNVPRFDCNGRHLSDVAHLGAEPDFRRASPG